MSGPLTAVLVGQAVTAGGNKGTGLGYRATGSSDANPSAPTLGIAASDYGGGTGATEIDFVESGLIEDESWAWTPFKLVYADDGSGPTQTFNATAAYRVLGIAVSPTQIMLFLPQPSYARAAAAARPLMISDANPVPHQATDAERPLHKDFLGIGGPSAVQPSAHREVTAEYVDNTHLALRMMGDDGTVRSVTLTVA